jgi:hypothetical protein
MLPQPIFVPEDMPVVAEKYLPSGNRLVLEAFLRQGEDLDEALSRGFMLDRLPGYHISALRVEAVKEASTRLEQLFSKNLKQTSLGGVSLRDKSSAVESHVGWEELPVSERLERVVQEGEKGTLSSVLNLWQKVGAEPIDVIRCK